MIKSKKIRGILLGSVLLGSAQANQAAAFGLNTHLWIAQQIIDDLDDNCRTQIGLEKARLPKDVCQSIRDYPDYFLAGAIGPDGFPDIIAGQTVVHPGVENGWKTSDWLNHLYQKASSGKELAFAAGYLVHAASDTFAHTYVNNYAGDEFSIADERRVEIRHFVLEKYIDTRLPQSEVNVQKLKVPAKFLRDNLIYHKSAAVNSARSGIALHIPAMYTVKESVGQMADAVDDLEDSIASIVAALIPIEAQFEIDIRDLKVDLGFLKEALKLQERKLAEEKKALDAAKRGLDSAINDAENNANIIIDYQNSIIDADNKINSIRNAADRARNSLGGLEDRLNNIKRQVDNLADQVANVVCSPPFGVPTPRVCDRYDDAKKARDRARAALREAKDNIAKESTRVAAQTAIKVDEIRKKGEAEALTAGFAGARRDARAAYDLANTKYQAELDLTVNSRKAVADTEVAIAVFQEQLAEIQFGKEDLEKLLAHLDLISGPLKNWETGVDKASEAFINTSLVVAKKMATSEEGAVGEYVEWFGCHGVAFMGIPHQVGEASCFARDSLAQIQKDFDEFVVNSHPEPIKSVMQDFADLKEEFRGNLTREVETAGIELAKFASPDGTTGDFIELIVRPEYATKSKLNEVFRSAADANGKKLLKFENVSDEIDKDIGLANDTLNPKRFKALNYAVKFSQLSLLSQAGLERFVWKMGGPSNNLGNFQNGKRQSILIESLRSIDGNHQWQPYGLPYPRSSGDAEPVKASERNFGWGPLNSDRKGLSLFIDEGLRRSVFLSLFPDPMAGQILARPELAAANYGFPACARNPFPVAFESDGTAAERDHLCVETETGDATSRPASVKRKRLLRKILGFFGFGPSDR